MGLSLPDGTDITLHGYADRLELDAEGRVVVIDLKTGKYPPPDGELAMNPQLGLYQLAVEHGGVDSLLPEGVEPVSGGAELWQLRKDRFGKLKVQRQDVQLPDDAGVRPIELQLMSAAADIRDEQFPARPGTYCDRCDFSSMCPAQTAGTVLS